ncbi:MAG: nucleoside deaminase [Simkaniaceae bacterium]
MNKDYFYMEEALKEANKSFQKKEVPVGAVLVFQGKIIARAHNSMEALQDPTAHAEMLCIRKGAKVLKNWRLLGTTLYTTLEPCSMCAGALFLARIERLVWGAPDLRHGANGSFVDLFSHAHPTHEIQVKKGMLAEKSEFLLKEFFRLRREKRL